MTRKMPASKYIMLTFDYELFFFRAGTLENCILKPVNRLVECFDQYNIKATFFIDILYYLRVADNGATIEQSKLIKEQLQLLVSKGHRIELHLHPHWSDAVYDNGSWRFPDYRYFRLQNLPQEKVTELFVTGVEALQAIAREVTISYKPLAFRAGGWCVQPFDKLKEGFLKTGLKIDSSVAYGVKGETDSHYYDFTSAPDLEYYWFTDNPLSVEENGEFLQIPITTYLRSTAEKLYKKAKAKLTPETFKIFGDGTGKVVKKSYWQRFLPTREMFSIEYMLPETLIKRVEECDKWLVNFLSHPKGLSPISFTCIEQLSSQGYSFINMEEAFIKFRELEKREPVRGDSI